MARFINEFLEEGPELTGLNGVSVAGELRGLHVSVQSKLLRDQAARLLALSTQAREAGDSALADLYAEAAAACLGKLVLAEQAEASHSHPPANPPTVPQQQQQQQEQIQRKDD